MKIDLHLHTDYSDGRMTPEELLELCNERGYNIVSITDHDTIDGYLSVKDIASSYGITLIPGVEISANYNDIEVHIAAYFFDDSNEELHFMLRQINTNRIHRAKQIVDKLAAYNIYLDFNQILKSVGRSRIVGRLHIARAMIEEGYSLTIKSIFNRYLGDDARAYVPKQTPPVDKVIKLISKAGGISILAHPHRLDNIATVNGVIEAGVDGLEVYCPRSSAYAIGIFEQLAEQHNLLITGGSDFHGEPDEIIDFGSYSLDIERWQNIQDYMKELKNEKVRYL